MELLNLSQGSEEWLEARLNFFCASEAPAMMGESKFMSRNQLLDLKKGWAKNPDSSFKKKLFEKGHLHEDQARELLEMEYCEDFPAAVGFISFDGLDLLASFDGLGNNALIFEHKDWNLTLSENVRNSVLEPMYYWQLEHQMIVASADQVMFVCSDGTSENKVSMIYDSVPSRRLDLIAGWKQFDADLSAHELEAKVEKVVAKATSFPSITCTVNNGQISTNIGMCLSAVKDLAELEMSKTLETDLDFANKEQQNKDVKSLRAKLKEKVEQVRGEFVAYSEFEGIANELDSVLQKMQSDGEKKVKAEKETKKKIIVNQAEFDLQSHITNAEKEMVPFLISSIYGRVSPDWSGAIKNKRTIESIESSVSEELSKWKVEINKVVEASKPNIAYLLKSAEDYQFLFQDAPSLVNQSEESFKAVVDSRINNHKVEQDKKLEEQREAIRKEEAEKLLAKQERELSWREMASYAANQLTHEEVEDVVYNIGKQANQYKGDPVFDEARKEITARYNYLLESSKVKSKPDSAEKVVDQGCIDATEKNLEELYPLQASHECTKKNPCGGCPDCSPVMGDVTYNEMDQDLKGMSAQENIIDGLKSEAYEALRRAEQKFYAYACELPVGIDRGKAFEIYENIRMAARVF